MGENDTGQKVTMKQQTSFFIWSLLKKLRN